MKRYTVTLVALAAIMCLAPGALGVTITEVDPNQNTWFFRDFNGNTAPGSVSFNNAQFDSIGGGTAIYDSTGAGSDPQINFGGGAIPLPIFPNFRSRYSITGGSSTASAWRNPAVGGQSFNLPDNATGLAEAQATVPNDDITTAGYRMDPVSSGTGWSVEYDYIVADRARTIGIEYDHDGDDQTGNGVSYNAAWASSTVSGGVLSGQANPGGGGASDVQIGLLGLGVDPDIYKFLEFRIKGFDGDRIDLFFSNTTTGGVELRQITPDSQGVWRTFLVDLNDEAAWSGTLDFLRIDPTVSSNATFEVDYIRFYETALSGPIVFLDTFNSANNTNITTDANLTRQSGLLAPSGWTENKGSGNGGNATGVAIDGGQLAFTLDATGSGPLEQVDARLDQNMGSAVAGKRWSITYDLTFDTAAGPDQWAAISLSDDAQYGPNNAQVELGFLLRPNGGWSFWDNGSVTPGSGVTGLSHEIEIVIDERGSSVLASIIVDGVTLIDEVVISFADADRLIGLRSFMNDTASTVDNVHRIDNFSIQVIPAPAALPAGLALITLAAARRRRR